MEADTCTTDPPDLGSSLPSPLALRWRSGLLDGWMDALEWRGKIKKRLFFQRRLLHSTAQRIDKSLNDVTVRFSGPFRESYSGRPIRHSGRCPTRIARQFGMFASRYASYCN